MIRLFLDICKGFRKLNKLNEIEVINEIGTRAWSKMEVCPSCGAPASAYHKDGHYERDFICYENGTPKYHKITICCVECNSCGHSHALIPSVIVPYSSYSLGFLMSVLHAKITKKFSTLEQLCVHFEISISTYYRICKRFLTDSFRLHQLLADTDSFLSLYGQSAAQLHQTIHLFYREYGHSFLQPYIRFRPFFTFNNLPESLSRYIDNGDW